MSDGHKFRIVARGSEQRIRGIKWEGKRPDLLIGDDLEDDEQVESKERREKFKNWFFKALLPVLGKGGRAIIVGTILHFDSLLANLLKSESWYSVKFRAHNEDFSTILWPEMFPKERLELIRRDYINLGIPEGYSQEYLNEPLDESVAYFRKSDFEKMTPDDFSKRKEYYAAIDMAISQQERADYTAIAVCSVDEAGMLCVEHVLRDRMDSLQIIEAMFAIHAKYKPELFTVEQEKIAKAIGPFLEAEMFKRGIFINLNPLHPVKDKSSRARSIQARMRAGGVRFNTEASWFPDLQQEMLRFPKDKHDDMVDALAWVGLTLEKINEARPSKEIEDEEWEEFENENITYEGISLVCGY